MQVVKVEFSIFSLCFVFGLIASVLKFANIIAWSWLIIWLPTIICVGLWLLALAVVVLALFFVSQWD